MFLSGICSETYKVRVIRSKLLPTSNYYNIEDNQAALIPTIGLLLSGIAGHPESSHEGAIRAIANGSAICKDRLVDVDRTPGVFMCIQVTPGPEILTRAKEPHCEGEGM